MSGSVCESLQRRCTPCTKPFSHTRLPCSVVATGRSLGSGVDINTIRAWLGDVSLETTTRYAQVDLAMKAQALETCAVVGADRTPAWHGDRDPWLFFPRCSQAVNQLCGETIAQRWDRVAILGLLAT